VVDELKANQLDIEIDRLLLAHAHVVATIRAFYQFPEKD
jgi:hypothetical protein